MNILLATYGSRGDVQPMLALALALKSQGHCVLLAGPPERAGWAAQLNCPYYPLGRNIAAFVNRQSQMGALTAMAQSALFLRREIKTQFETLMKIAGDADLLIASSLVSAMSSVAEALQRPYYYLLFTPQLLPSANHPFPIFPYQNWPKWLNRLSWIWAQYCQGVDTTMIINRYRKQLGLSKTLDSWGLVLGKYVIVATDEAVSRVPEDVRSPQYTQTGYMHLSQPQSFLQQLDDFIEAGPPPIYAGFGSMSKKDQVISLKCVIDTARSAGQRLVVGKSWEQSSSYEKEDDIFVTGKCSHMDLFPRMRAVIHHGGAGTIAVAARCGTPQIIVPHLLDQHYWGKQIQERQLGPPPIRRSKLRIAPLTKAIQSCVENPLIQQNVQKTARQIRRTDGMKKTVEAIMNPDNMATAGLPAHAA